MNLYQFTYDYNNPESNKVYTVFTSQSEVKDWWHYLPNVYIFESDGDIALLTDKILASIKSLSFLITKIDLSVYNGVLHKDAWEWLRKKHNVNLRYKNINNNQLPPLPPLLSNTLFNTKPSNTDLKSVQKTLDQILGKNSK